jgi:hypothetical protein
MHVSTELRTLLLYGVTRSPEKNSRMSLSVASDPFQLTVLHKPPITCPEAVFGPSCFNALVNNVGHTYYAHCPFGRSGRLRYSLLG